ncbi:MAG: response regulator transcription factor [Elusimicrobiota bacterium]|nr:response regulator transcription factor [Elusimicrobiota bacterium]
MKKIRIIIIDDHPIFRSGLKLLLEEEKDMEIIGEATTGKEAIHISGSLKPDLAILDISLPDLNGVDVAKEILRKNSQIKILVLTMHESQEYLQEFLKIGVSGYIVKKAADIELIDAIRSVSKGNIYLHSIMAESLRESSQKKLSPREKEILILLANGLINKEIANKLYLSVKTVETYRTRLMKKLHVTGRSGLTQYAIKSGLFSL